MGIGSGDDLRSRAIAVLDQNRRGDWTCPSHALYPHQWLWDSCFVAIGLARRDPHRAAAELRSLFRAQWTNGMLPHLIFADGVHDRASRRMWRSKHDARAPRGIDTSCVTQPPLPAVAAWQVTRALPAAERAPFVIDLFPRIVRYHAWLYRERDPSGRGLVTLIHPWECGLDTTPPWMDQLARMRPPWWLALAIRFRLARLVRFVRRDTRYVPAAERPSDDDGLRMLALARLARRHGFELARLPRDRSVLIEDLAFNAILAAANRALARLADDYDLELPSELQRAIAATDAALEELWDESAGQYYSRNATTGALIRIPSVATFVPLWSEVLSPPRAEALITLLTGAGFWPRFPVPSVPTDTAQFEPERYWKGPTWVNMNWIIIQGLRQTGATTVADQLVHHTLGLVRDRGFFEYFSPLVGTGFGAEEFSWTAALALELLDSAPPDPPRSAGPRSA
jgi:hypothetical protein